MRAVVAVFVVVLAPPATASAQNATGDTGPLKWPNRPPVDSPFRASERFSGIEFTGPWANYCTADTFYPSWGADDKLYAGFMDGLCYSSGSLGGFGFPVTSMGTAVIGGDDPLRLEPFQTNTIVDQRMPYDGRYHSASLHHNGVWYYGSYLLNQAAQPGGGACNNYCTLGPFVGWHTSTNGGQTWTAPPHGTTSTLFGETPEDGRRVKLGALHVVDLGRNLEHSPDGKAYLVGHGASAPDSNNTWVHGDEVYLVRVTPSPQTINDESAYEYYAGEQNGQPRWSPDFADIKPLVTWRGRLGSTTITYNAALQTYLMWNSAPTDGVNTTSVYDTVVLESPSITGPWRLVHYLPKFGTQAYFVNTPSKFISADGSKLWMTYSANYNNSGGGSDPEGSGYTWVLRELRLERGAAPPPGGCAGKAPATSIRRVRVGRRATRVAGRARDGACGRVTRVEVSIGRRVGRGRCRFLGPRGRFGRARRCRRPVFTPARGGTKWRFGVRRRLPKGRYIVRARAVDTVGNHETVRTRRNTKSKRVGRQPKRLER